MGIWARLYWEPCWTKLGTTKRLYWQWWQPQNWIDEYSDLCWYLVGTICCFDPFSFNSLEPLKTFGRHSGPNIFQLYFVGHSVHMPVCPFKVPVCAFHGVSPVCPRSTYFWKTLERRVVLWFQRTFITIAIELSENGRCGLLVALCWTYYNLWSPIRGRYERLYRQLYSNIPATWLDGTGKIPCIGYQSLVYPNCPRTCQIHPLEAPGLICANQVFIRLIMSWKLSDLF